MNPAQKAQIKGIKPEVVLAKNQPQYLTLAVAVDGDTVTSRWQLSFKERLKVFLHGNIFATLQNFEQPPMPILLTVEEPTWLLPGSAVQPSFIAQLRSWWAK